MSRDDFISEEQLSAFVDGELDTEEESRIFGLSEVSGELDSRLCQQRRMKEMVQHAYRDVPEYRRSREPGAHRWSLFHVALAASLMLTLGVIAGFVGGRALEGSSAGAAAGVVQQDTWLLHVTSSDPERMAAALRRADELINDPQATTARRVEIVANESGLDLLRSDVTPFAPQIRRLAEQDVLFFACARAIERLEQQGVDVQLLPEADTRFTALDRVVKRLSSGWQYEKI
jgi:intracellular sulfur oxidation DsrE/DsrF family protein